MRKTEIIPVIHMINFNQVHTNVKICMKCGIEKVFLINHHVSPADLIDTALEIKKLYPNLWVGINMLGVTSQNALSTDWEGDIIDGLWCDETVSSKDAENWRDSSFKGMFFGGLAFKYQPQPKDLKEACKESALATDVSTTSGPGTAKAAAIEKIKSIREYLGDHPMAIASGVSVDNIEDYNGIADYLLVASSITSKSEMIIEDKLIELIRKI